MRFLKCLLFSVVLLSYTDGYKIVIFVPYFVNSQVLFNSRVAETLSKNGHEVTMVMVAALDGFDTKAVKIPKHIKTYNVNASIGIKAEAIEEMLEKNIFEDLPVWDYRQRAVFLRASSLFLGSCRKMVENKDFLEWISGEKFDLAITYILNVCPVGIIHHAKIPAWIWLNSAPLLDPVARHMGVPLIPSYVPPVMIDSSDVMNFKERIRSFIVHMLFVPIWKRMIADKETAIYREVLEPNFPDLLELGKRCPLVMVNTNELYDFPRPTLAKIVNIGGVGFQQKDVKPLDPKFQKIVEQAEGVVLFSFGSVAPTDKMPMTWKNAFIDAFKRFPNHHFIWRYVGNDLKDKLPPNVHTFEWFPQSDLLQSPKTKAFITHGGYNSFQEAILAGVPLIIIPLFGDQPRNARLGEKHHFAVKIHKSDISANTVAEALEKVLYDQSYSSNMTRMSNMVKKQPVNPSDLLVSWVEFVAEFKTLDNLVPAGNKLNFVQYHSLDVIAFLLTVVVALTFIAYKIVKLMVKKAFPAFPQRKYKEQ
ncbi:unnamed protein product [Cylicocyclus nassatus]|uniref:UDP-glucuronosyltransferase n=1 Tax=Cylicocyclus nassatus TaxID=53992 RepID=A0AA36M8X9_CYLNA|nr:unnamed protein product [Cylicocyclus nassatus]